MQGQTRAIYEGKAPDKEDRRRLLAAAEEALEQMDQEKFAADSLAASRHTLSIKVDTNELQNRRGFLAGDEGAGLKNEDAALKSKGQGELSHIDVLTNQPTMVDVQHKEVTVREATARSTLKLPSNVMRLIGEDGEMQSKKGPVFATAIIAGTMAAKNTHTLIPFCHPLMIESCKISIQVVKPGQVQIDCTVRVTGKTGVEMEALTGASVACLTVYDMCKAVSHDMVIGDTRLLTKSGGKSDYIAPDRVPKP
jgi:cyclic pyranopterin monophosphate synthase